MEPAVRIICDIVKTKCIAQNQFIINNISTYIILNKIIIKILRVIVTIQVIYMFMRIRYIITIKLIRFHKKHVARSNLFDFKQFLRSASGKTKYIYAP